MQTTNYRRFHTALMQSTDYNPTPFDVKVFGIGYVKCQLRPISEYWRLLLRLQYLTEIRGIQFHIEGVVIKASTPGATFTATLDTSNYPRFVLGILFDAILPYIK